MCSKFKQCSKMFLIQNKHSFLFLLYFLTAADSQVTLLNSEQIQPPLLQEFDFIVVGAGTAGCIIANRLSEVKNWRVLLLEAGLEEFPIDIPVLSPLWQLSDYNWKYTLEREDGICQSMTNRVCLAPSAKAVGGASVIGDNIYTRGNAKDFDHWSSLGNPGWSYQEILPYFLKSEHMTISELAGSPYHSTNGPINVEFSYATPILEGFLEGAKELGYSLIDYNNPNTHIGFSPTQVTMKRGRRISVATAYITPIRNRTNFYLIKNALVTKILIDPKSKEANGVEYLMNRRKYTVFARKEVIVSAGTFNSPKLLMLSGIGPGEHLSELKIPIIKDLRVGNNLQEHLTTFVTFLINATGTFTFRERLRTLFPDLNSWARNGTGPLTSVGCDGLAYIKTQPEGEPSVPDVELMLIPTSPAGDGGIFYRSLMNIPASIYNSAYGNILFREAYSLFSVLLYPESRGSVRLRSGDSSDPPKIVGNYLTHPKDLKTVIDGIRFIMRLSQTKAMQRLGSKLHDTPIPRCKNLKFGTDDYWECALRELPVLFHHEVGTCMMGPDPTNAVVNSRLLVHGIKNIRVADASIMPTTTGGHTMAPVYMIGEKAADLIKEDWEVIKMK